ncbi:MAG: NADH-quinone oxidoreductase subunit NuoF [Nitrospiraceae bacterium]|nr:NADH-quinone oxidoreductase subunit NuoF [Nitrospiraceae bacterium]
MKNGGNEKPLTGDFRADGMPLGIREYEKAGGYLALRRAMKEMSPSEVTEEVKASRLRGRGGAGFPTGLKWSFVPTDRKNPGPKYIMANADEMEPGSFKDRILMEHNPHMLIEGMLIAAHAIGAGHGFIFLRMEYWRSARAIERALAEAREKNYMGENILGTGFNVDLHLHTSAGRYMCGEETGLLNAMEGKRAMPRAKPPYPQTSGFMGRPTVVNNVETLCSVPQIIRNGAEWYRGLSVNGSQDGGTKIYGVSGKVKRPGAWELPMGTMAREILEEHAGGMREGHRLRALIPGGASTPFMLEEHLDVRMDFDSVQSVGSRMGTGTMIILDDGTCPVGMLISLQVFYARESCGWCTPCREGLPWVVHALKAIEAGEGRMEDIDLLLEQARLLGPGNTFCGLAPGAAEPLGSGVRYFRDDLERHIREKGCPWKKTKSP